MIFHYRGPVKFSRCIGFVLRKLNPHDIVATQTLKRWGCMGIQTPIDIIAAAMALKARQEAQERIAA